MNQVHHYAAPRARQAAGRVLRHVLVAGVVAAGASFGTAAFAQHGHAQMGGPGMSGPGMGGAGMSGMFMARPEHMNRMLDRWLDGVNATDAQRAQIKQIALGAASDLRAQREAGRGLREQSLQLLAAPTIDAQAAESLRQRMLAQHDQASRRVTQAMLESANVLTPEQRVKMVERMKQRGERMREQMREGENGPRTAPANS